MAKLDGSINDPITYKEVEYDGPIIMEFCDYLRWLALEDSGLVLTAGQIWLLYEKGVRFGIAWDEVADELGLPERKEW